MLKFLYQWTNADILAPTAEGMEWTLPGSLLHYTLPDNSLGYTLPDNKLHYTEREEDG